MIRYFLSLIYFSIFSYIHGEEIQSKISSSTFPWNMEIETSNGSMTTLTPWKGQVLLVVNIATECGLSGQIQELETLYNNFKSKGFSVLAFPSNDFLNQEPHSNTEIQGICSTQYHTTFPIFGKVHVRGQDIHPLYQWLTSTQIQGKRGGRIMWNYTKFIIDQEGNVVERYSPITSPLNSALQEKIEACLKNSQTSTIKE